MLREKTALITGSIAGLGYAMASALAEQGSNIILHGLEPTEQAQAAATQLEKKYDIQVLCSRANLTQVSEIEQMMQSAQIKFGAIDIVINNAVIRNFSAVDTLETSKWDESIAVNLSSAFHTARLAIPQMKKKGWGRIINICIRSDSDSESHYIHHNKDSINWFDTKHSDGCRERWYYL